MSTVVKQNGSSFRFKTEERFFMKLEEKVHAKEEETRQLQARKQKKKEAEIKQLRRNLNFKATPMPAFYREPGRRSEKNKDGQSWEEAGARAAELASKTKSQSRPSTAAGARATSATENTVRCLRAEVYNRCSTNERLNVADSPQVSEVTIHPSAELSNSSVPSAATSKTSKQTESNRTVAPRESKRKGRSRILQDQEHQILSGGTRTLKLKTKQRFLHEEQETMQRGRMLEVWT
ncbi:hypothetical protein P3L10_031466 [Capsicum annuum]